MSTPDWTAIKAEYVTTKISYKKLCEKYGVSNTTMARKATEEGWVEERKKYEKKLATKIIDKTAEKVSRKEANKLARAIRITNGLAKQFEEVVKDPDQFKRYIVECAQINPDTEAKETVLKEQVLDKYNVKAMKEFTSAVKDLVEVIRNVNNLPFVEKEEGGGTTEVKVTIGLPDDDYGV